MIVYLVTNRHRYTIQKYLDGWMPQLRTLIRVTPYERLVRANGLSPGTYIFSDLERLSGPLKRAADQAHERLQDMENVSTVLNDPSRSLMRYDLLRTLRGLSINDFSAYRLRDTRHPHRFPVFIREEVEHRILTPLLHDQRALDQAIARLYVRHRGLDRLLMIEFCDTSDGGGEFRKYSAFIIGDEIIPKHVFFSRHWLIKQSDFVDADRLREEGEYLETNPHESELRRIFEIAKISYGRIDYAVSNGGFQVWEINTNPMILAPSDRVKTERLPFKNETSRVVADAFRAIDDSRSGSRSSPPPALAPRNPPTRTLTRANISVRLARKFIRRSRGVVVRIVDPLAKMLWRPVIALLEITKWK